MGRAEQYRAELRRLTEWEPFLKKNSGLPGPRANLELVQAVGEEAGAERLWRLSASSDEFLALCGTAGLGHIAIADPVSVISWLRELAADPRWRVREGVAIALQHLGRHSMPRLLAEMEKWSTEGPYQQRAAAAGLCEPSLLKEPEDVARVLKILDRITRSLAATGSRKGEDLRVLRQTLAYSWSVAAAALPESGRPLLEKWLRSPDKDVAWVMQANLARAHGCARAGVGRAVARETPDSPGHYRETHHEDMTEETPSTSVDPTPQLPGPDVTPPSTPAFRGA